MAYSSTEDLTFHTLIKKVIDTDANVSVVRPITRSRSSDRRSMPSGVRTRSSEIDSPSVMLRSKMKDKLKRTSSASKHLSVRKTSMKKAVPAPLFSLDTEDTPRTILKHIFQTAPEVPLVVPDRRVIKEPELDSRLETTQNSSTELSLSNLSESTAGNIVTRPKKKQKKLSLAQFKKGVGERLQRYKEMNSSSQEEASINASFPSNVSEFTRSLKLFPDSLGDPDSVEKKGLIRRPKKLRLINVEDFEQRVDQNFQMRKEMNCSRQEETSINVSLPGNVSDLTRSFTLVSDSLGDPESVEKKGLSRRPKKLRMINVEDFEQRVEQNFQKQKGRDGGTQEELCMSSSAPTNQSAMMRSFKLSFDTPNEPESVERKGLARRTIKHRIVNLENFEGAVECNFQLLKGSQECFIEPLLTETDQSISALVLTGNETDIVLGSTALYAQPLPKKQNLQDCSATSEPRPSSLSKEEVIDANAINKFDAQPRLSSDLGISKQVSKAGNEEQLLHKDDNHNNVTMEYEVEERVDGSKNGTFEILMEKEAQMDLNVDDMSRVMVEVMDFENLERLTTSSCKGADIISSSKLHDVSQAITSGTNLLAVEELDDSVFQSIGAMYTLQSAPPNDRLKHETETSALQESQGRAETTDNENMDHAKKSLQTHETEFELMDEKEGKHLEELDKLAFATANNLATAEEEEHLSENICMQNPDPEAMEEEGSAPRMFVEDFDIMTEVVVVSEDAEAEEPISESFEEEESTSKLEDEVESSFQTMDEENSASEALEKEEHASSEFEEEENAPKYVLEGFDEHTPEKAAVEEPSFEEEQKVEETIEEDEERGMQTYEEEENEAQWQIEVHVAGSKCIEGGLEVQEESFENEETPEGEASDILKINAQENDPQYVVGERSVKDEEELVTVELESKPTIEEVGESSSEEKSFDEQTDNDLEDQEVGNINLGEVEVGEETLDDSENETQRHTGIVLVESKVFEVSPEVQKENTEEGKIPNKVDKEENASTYGVEEKYAMMEESASLEAEVETIIDAIGDPGLKVESLDERTQENGGVDEKTFEEEQEVEDINMEESEEQTHGDEGKETHEEMDVELLESEELEEGAEVQNENPTEGETSEEEEDEFPKMEVQPVGRVEENISRNERKDSSPVGHSASRKTSHTSGIMSSQESKKSSTKQRNPTAASTLRRVEKSSSPVQSSGWTDDEVEDQIQNGVRSFNKVIRKTSRQSGTMSSRRSEKSATEERNQTATSTLKVKESSHPMHSSGSTDDEGEDHMKSVGKSLSRGSPVSFPADHAVSRKTSRQSGTMSSRRSEKSATKERNQTATSTLKVKESSHPLHSSGSTDDEEEDHMKSVGKSLSRGSPVSFPAAHAVTIKTSHQSGTMSSQRSDKSATKERNQTATSTLKVKESSHPMHSSGSTDDEEEDHMKSVGKSLSRGSSVSFPADHAVSRKTSSQSGTMSSRRSEKSATKERNQTATSALQVKESSRPMHSSGWTDDEEEDHMNSVGESLSRGSRINSHSIRPTSVGLNKCPSPELTSSIQKSATEGVEFSKAHRRTASKSRTSMDQSDVREDEDGEQSTDEEGTLSEELTMDRNDFQRKRLRKGAELSSTLTTPNYLKPSNAKRVTKKLQVAKCASKINVLQKKEPRLPSSLIRQTFAHYAKMKVAKDAYEVVETSVNSYLEQLSADLEAYTAHAGRTTVEASDVELLMRRQGLVTDEMPMTVLIERYLPLEYRRLLIPVATSGNKVVLQ